MADLKTFLGIMIFVGLNPSTYKDMWSTHRLMERPGFRKVMPRDRFTAILQFLHLEDNANRIANGEVGHDRLYKVRSTILLFVAAWQEAFNQEANVAVDEAMIAFKGQTSLKQYLKSKPKKWGMKAWVLAGSKSGYVTEFYICEGKDDVALQVGQGVVMKLAVNVQEGQTITMDNFFTSPQLFAELKKRGIGAIGTVRANRIGNPPQMSRFKKGTRKAELVRLSPMFLRNTLTGVLAVAWMDKRPVTLLSTVSGAGVKEVRIRAKGHREGRIINKPDAIEDYNSTMSGVDHSDQYNSYYVVNNKSRKWWKKVFFHLMNTSVTNAFILYKLVTPVKKQLSGRLFRLQIADALMASYQLTSERERRHPSGNHQNQLPPSLGCIPQRLEGGSTQHFIELGPTRRDCVVCTILKRRRDPTDDQYKHRKPMKYRCKTCYPKVPLCQLNCFEIYHTQENPRDFWYNNFYCGQ